MNDVDRARLKTRLKAPAQYRWPQMEAALAAHDREAYAWHAAWRAAITKELKPGHAAACRSFPRRLTGAGSRLLTPPCR